MRSYSNIDAHAGSVAYAAQTRVWRESYYSAEGKVYIKSSEYIGSTTACLASGAAMQERERSERASTCQCILTHPAREASIHFSSHCALFLCFSPVGYIVC